MSKLDHVSFSRRQLLAGAAATAGLAASAVAPAAAKAPLTNTQAPSFYRFKIGSIEATVVSDGPLPIGPATRTFRGKADGTHVARFACSLVGPPHTSVKL